MVRVGKVTSLARRGILEGQGRRSWCATPIFRVRILPVLGSMPAVFGYAVVLQYFR
jgi:hypothetical protein